MEDSGISRGGKKLLEIVKDRRFWDFLGGEEDSGRRDAGEDGRFWDFCGGWGGRICWEGERCWGL